MASTEPAPAPAHDTDSDAEAELAQFTGRQAAIQDISAEPFVDIVAQKHEI